MLAANPTATRSLLLVPTIRTMTRDWNKSKFTSIPVMAKAKETALDQEPFITKYVHYAAIVDRFLAVLI